MTEPRITDSMLARVGGADAISRIVESFYVRIEADSHMRPIYPEDLDAWAKKAGIKVEPGDVVLVRTG